ncbi:MAG: HAD family phosphatase [Bacteroidales bacterium]|nr:HAD family phosphatase [Bacteroidales bacterium]
MIKNVVLDLGGVIVKLDRAMCVESFRKIGYENFGSVLDNYLQKDFFLDFEKGNIPEQEFRNIIRSNIKNDVTDKEIDNAMGDFLSEISQEKFNSLRELRKRYKLSLLSNTNTIAVMRVRELFRLSGTEFEDYFDNIHLSYQMGMVKPDPVIFMEVLAREGAEASETLFCDDSPANIISASSLGIKTLHTDYDSDLFNSVTGVV